MIHDGGNVPPDDIKEEEVRGEKKKWGRKRNVRVRALEPGLKREEYANRKTEIAQGDG